MKKALISIVAILFLAAYSEAASRYTLDSAIGPVYVSTNAAIQPTIIISSPTVANGRNCLTYIVITATNAFTPSIFSNATQIFGAGTTAAAGNFVKEFPFDDPLCAAVNTNLVIKSSATAVQNTTMNMSYQGYVGR